MPTSEKKMPATVIRPGGRKSSFRKTTMRIIAHSLAGVKPLCRSHCPDHTRSCLDLEGELSTIAELADEVRAAIRRGEGGFACVGARQISTAARRLISADRDGR
jgi:hypothetical protein